MLSPRGKIEVLACHPTKLGNKAEDVQGILKEGSINVPLTSCLTGLESAV